MFHILLPRQDARSNKSFPMPKASINRILHVSRHADTTHRLLLLYHHFNSPLPPISLVISSILSKGNGGHETGFIASDISFMGLSSAAIRLELNAPQTLQRWMSAHSPFFLTHTEIGSITPPQSAARSPGVLSRCRLDRQYGQWFR